MANCCNPRGCDRIFTQRQAERAARRYRAKGIDRTAQRMIAFLTSRGVEDATVLEVGGGVGDLQIELLKRGAAHTTNLELSPAYDEAATRLLRESGFEAKAERRLHDIATEPQSVEPADIVLLHRVVCCYPDYERLLRATAERARRLLVFSYPPNNGGVRLWTAGENLFYRLRRSEFRTFVHPPARMRAVVEECGLPRTYSHHSFVWQIAGFEREAPARRVGA